MQFKLQPLDYSYDAMAPHIGASTVEIHYSKHHKGYLDKLEKAIGGTKLAEEGLEDIVCKTEGSTFNNAAQVWNHDFYWKSMTPKGGGEPKGELAEALKRDFGSVDDFRHKFAEAAKSEFGSGWAWLVHENGKLRIRSTTDAENPLIYEQIPLLTIDVWEHAYYLDYQNERAKYVKAFIDHLINWDFVTSNMKNIRE